MRNSKSVDKLIPSIVELVYFYANLKLNYSYLELFVYFGGLWEKMFRQRVFNFIILNYWVANEF